MNRHRFMTLWVIVGMLLAGCRPITQPSSTDPIRLKVLLLPYDSFAPFFIAQEEGYFAEQGLAIEFVKMDGSSDGIPLIAQGEIDVWAGSIGVGLFNAIARTDSIKIVADKGYIDPAGCTYLSSLTPADSDLATVADLRGKSIGSRATALQGYFLARLLEQGDLAFADTTLVDLPNPIKGESLANGSVAMVIAGEPWISQIMQQVSAKTWITAQEVIPNFQFGAIVYGSALLQDNPEAGRRFMVAYHQAVTQYNEGKTERNLAIMAKYTEQELAFVQKSCWPPLHTDGLIDIDSVMAFQQWAADSGEVNAVLEPEQFWDPAFTEYANEQTSN